MTKPISTAAAWPASPGLPSTGPEPHVAWTERRAWFRARFAQHSLAGLGKDEVEAHFQGMPEHYWKRVNEADLLWGIETIHGFFRQVTAPEVPATLPFVTWRQAPSQDRTRVMLCTWDRQGLLAKAAAAFTAVRLNILQADVFTRADNVVLDTFTIAEFDGPRAASATRLQEMTFLLEGALSEPPRFASVWACSRHRFLAPRGLRAARVSIDTHSSPSGTLVQVAAPDRLGLLYDVLEAIASQNLRVSSARIETDQDEARDVIEVTDALGRKLVDSGPLGALRRSIESALSTPD